MPTDLPRPRDREEREKMVAAWLDGNRRYSTGELIDLGYRRPFPPAGPVRQVADSLVPPVSEASPEGMPELAYPWGYVDRKGECSAAWATREEAVAEERGIQRRQVLAGTHAKRDERHTAAETILQRGGALDQAARAAGVSQVSISNWLKTGKITRAVA